MSPVFTQRSPPAQKVVLLSQASQRSLSFGPSAFV